MKLEEVQKQEESLNDEQLDKVAGGCRGKNQRKKYTKI
jgi:hypothetical protein